MYKFTKFYVKIRGWFFFLLWLTVSILSATLLVFYLVEDEGQRIILDIIVVIVTGIIFYRIYLIDPKIIVNAKKGILCLLNAEGNIVNFSDEQLFRPEEDSDYNYNYFIIIQPVSASTSTRHRVSIHYPTTDNNGNAYLDFVIDYSVKYNSADETWRKPSTHWELFRYEWVHSPKLISKKSSIPRYSVEQYILNFINLAKDHWLKESAIVTANNDSKRAELANKWLKEVITPGIKNLNIVDSCKIKAITENDIKFTSYYS